MFGLGITEIFVIVVIVIVLIRPEDLPGFFKSMGKSYGEIKKTCNEAKKMKDDFINLAETDITKAAANHAKAMTTKSSSITKA